jgi:hypothetical protein
VCVYIYYFTKGSFIIEFTLIIFYSLRKTLSQLKVLRDIVNLVVV